jgi:hypothetical protein
VKRKNAEGVTADPRVTPAANEEFPGMVTGLDGLNGLDRLAYPRSGWDPYEVWRTRVKASSRMKPERERDPLR